MLVRISLVAAVAATALLAATASAARAKPNVVQTAVAAGKFKILVALAREAGLAGALSTKTVTVFAPTDAAFARVPKSTLAKLHKDKALLRKVLLYHVAAGRLTASEVAARSSVKTLAGRPLPVIVDGSTVAVGGTKVVKANIGARNGIIHVIDRVLIP